MGGGRAVGRRVVACAAAVLVACGPRTSEDVGTTGPASTTTTGSTTTTTTGPSDAPGTSGSSLPCPDSTGPSPPPLDLCDVEPRRSTSVEIEGISPSEATSSCSVAAVTSARATEVVLELDCTSPEEGAVSPVIRMTSDDLLPFPISAGDELLLGFAGGGLFDDVFLTLRRPDASLVLAWISSTWIPSADEPTNPPASILEPLALAFADEDCGYACDPNEGCFIENSCPCQLRLALDVRFDDATQRIVDGDSAVLGGDVSVHVVQASIVVARDGGPCDATDIFPWVRVLAIVRDVG